MVTVNSRPGSHLRLVSPSGLHITPEFSSVAPICAFLAMWRLAHPVCNSHCATTHHSGPHKTRNVPVGFISEGPVPVHRPRGSGSLAMASQWRRGPLTHLSGIKSHGHITRPSCLTYGPPTAYHTVPQLLDWPGIKSHGHSTMPDGRLLAPTATPWNTAATSSSRGRGVHGHFHSTIEISTASLIHGRRPGWVEC